jgi:REP element-mobilizing transposase RayT
MGSTFYSLHHHLIFSTKDRRPLIKSNWRPRLHEYLGGVVRGLGGVAEIVGGVDDHVHLLLSVKTSVAPADLVREIKKASSTWAADTYDRLFHWQEGYGIFSVSWTHCNSIRRYIEEQERHYHKTTFVEEYRRILERNGVSYDPALLE